MRVRIAVPLEGLGRRIEIMRAWLDRSCGIEGWATALAGMAGIAYDAIAFYFEDAASARDFVARFCCGYRGETSGGAFALRSDAAPARRAVSAPKTP